MVTTRTSLADCFRVFIPHPPPDRPALRQLPRDNQAPPLTVYTDGSCLDNGLQNARSGAGIWIEDAHPLNRAIRVPGPLQSNQIGELAAILIAAQSAPPSADLMIITDLIYAIRVLNHSLAAEEDAGWTNTPNATWIRAAAYHLRRRCAPTHFKWVKGHNGTKGNEEADRLANEGVNKPTTDEVDLSVPEHFQCNRIKLTKMTQALAYAHISSLGKPQTPRRVEILLERIRISLDATNSQPPTNRAIWKGCRNQDIRRPVQTFLFKAINDALRIGDFWSRIPNLENRARCSSCNEAPENLEHILLDCDHTSTKTIWSLTKRHWPHDNPPWPDLCLGILLGCGNITLTTTDHPANKGPSRLLRILLSESAHLIWVLHCERTIQGTEHSVQKVK